MTQLTAGLVGRETAEYLSELAAKVPASQAIVEIGVFMARTTAFLARDASAYVYGIDPWDLPGDRYPYQWLVQKRHRRDFIKPQTRLNAAQLILDLGLAEKVTLIQGFSVDVAATWDGPPVGLLLVDGDHREEMVRADWEAWSPHLAEDAVVVWDDYHPAYPGVCAVVDSLVDAGALRILNVFARGKSALAVTM